MAQPSLTCGNGVCEVVHACATLDAVAMRRTQLARARKAAGYTQENLAEALHVERSTVNRWESGRNEPLPYLRPKLAKLIGITQQQLEEFLSANLEISANRREFLSIAAMTVATVKIAQEFTASISSRDAGPLAQVQTTYGTDRAIAAMIDTQTRNVLRRWTMELSSPIARVNATGILAKLPNQGESEQVVAILRRDDEVRILYTTAVTARVCAVNWDQATDFVRNPTGTSFSSIAAERFARETINPHDTGARWCSAKLLQELSPVIGG